MSAPEGRPWPSSQWTDAAVDEAAAAALGSALRLSPAAARILVARGHADPEDAAAFLRPLLKNCMLPDRLPGIAEAADIVARHVGLGEPIVVFGDFDADGMTAATILHAAILGVGGHASVFIPDRIHEGYGFTEAALDRCLSEHPGARLIVTVDCGISHAPACDKAVAQGVEVVVTDHHEVGLDVPRSASALVNPCLPGTPEPLRHLCGAGVAFKLAHELVRRLLPPDAGPRFMQPLVAIAAVGTIGDLVPLVGENRIIASRGLDILNRARPGELVGLRALQSAARLSGDVDSGAMAFVLVPRINAAGRVGNPRVAIDLLAARDLATALPLAHKLGDFNALRREEEAAALRSAEEEVRAAPREGRTCFILHNRGWHPGVIGLVASRLSNRHHLPSIVFTADDEPGFARGSARCPEIPGLDLMQLLERCRDLLATFGGHRAAAGLTLPEERLGEFRERFAAVCAEAERGLDMRPESRVEAWIRPDEADAALEADLARIGPFGTLNPQPLLGMRGLTLARDPSRFGRTTVNWRLEFAETPVPGVVFGRPEMPFRVGDRLDAVFHFARDNFGAPQFFLRDLRRA